MLKYIATFSFELNIFQLKFKHLKSDDPTTKKNCFLSYQLRTSIATHFFSAEQLHLRIISEKKKKKNFLSLKLICTCPVYIASLSIWDPIIQPSKSLFSLFKLERR